MADNNLNLQAPPGVFSQFLQPPAIVQGMEAAKQVGQPVGSEGKTGQIAYFLDTFLRGAAAGKARQAATTEYHKYQDDNRLSQLMQMTQQPGLDPDAAKEAQMQILKVMGGRFVEETKDSAKKNPMINVMHTIASSLLGGPEAQYSGVKEKGSGKKGDKDEVGFDQLFSSVATIPTTASIVEKTLPQYDQEVARATEAYTKKTGQYPLNFADINPYLSPQAQAMGAKLKTRGMDVESRFNYTAPQAKQKILDNVESSINSAFEDRQVPKALGVGGLGPPVMETVRGGQFIDPQAQEQAIYSGSKLVTQQKNTYVNGVPQPLNVVRGQYFDPSTGFRVDPKDVKTSQDITREYNEAKEKRLEARHTQEVHDNNEYRNRVQKRIEDYQKQTLKLSGDRYKESISNHADAMRNRMEDTLRNATAMGNSADSRLGSAYQRAQDTYETKVNSARLAQGADVNAVKAAVDEADATLKADKAAADKAHTDEINRIQGLLDSEEKSIYINLQAPGEPPPGTAKTTKGNIRTTPPPTTPNTPPPGGLSGGAITEGALQ